MLDVSGPFGFQDVTESDALRLAEKPTSIERQTWHEIFSSNRKRNHLNRVEGFSPKAQKRLRELGRDEFLELHSIRLTGTGRLYGVLRGGVFYIIWWDRDHLVYPSRKKHT